MDPLHGIRELLLQENPNGEFPLKLSYGKNTNNPSFLLFLETERGLSLRLTGSQV